MLVIREGKPPVEMRTGDEPFEVLILSTFALWGIYGIVSLSRAATATTNTIPAWGAYTFFGFLFGGCLVSLLGIAYQVIWKRFLGFYIERSGLFALLGLSTAYSVWAWAASGAKAGGFILVLAGIGGGAVWRILRIRSDLRKVAKGGSS